MKLPIVRYGDPILRTKGKRIPAVDAHVRELAANMIETMHLANGIGLAAQQVGEALQLTVIDVSATRFVILRSSGSSRVGRGRSGSTSRRSTTFLRDGTT